MKTSKMKMWRLSLLALVFAVTFSACESPTAANEDDAFGDATLQELSESLSADLNLSPAQQQDMNEALARLGGSNNPGGDRDPGFLWELAAELQATLTDEQLERLLERASNRGGQGGPGGAGFDRGRGGQGGFGGPGGRGQRPDSLGRPDPFANLTNPLTDDQIAAIEAIRESFADQRETLIESFRNGDIERDAFHTQMQELHDAMKAEIEGVLTADQLAELEQLRAEREAEREAERAEREAEMEARRDSVQAVMTAVLGLTADQVTELDVLHADQQAAREALREQVEAGDLTREEAQAAMEALKADFDTALQSILTEEQYEIVQIHNALASRGGKGNRGRGGQGPRRGGPNGSPGGGSFGN